MHDGYANTYALKFMGHSFTLPPLPPPKLLKNRLGKRSEKSLYMSETQVKRVMSKSRPLLALLIKPLHPLAQSLLSEFKVLFSNDQPLGLPLLEKLSIRLTFYQVLLCPTSQLIGATPMSQSNYNDKSKSCVIVGTLERA